MYLDDLNLTNYINYGFQTDNFICKKIKYLYQSLINTIMQLFHSV